MKAKYLVQVYTNNPMMSVVPSGFYTINGTQTKQAALSILDDLQQCNESRQMRVISAKDFNNEIKQANRIAFNQGK